MFIDFVGLMLINMCAGFFLLGAYLFTSGNEVLSRKWAPPFAGVAVVALATGLNMVFHWPLPGAFNIVFGEPTVLLGAFFAGMALAAAFEWDPTPMGFYAFFGGILSVVLGIGIIKSNMTQTPLVSGIGFIASGAVGILLLPALLFRTSRGLRYVVGLIAILVALLWGGGRLHGRLPASEDVWRI